MKIGKYKVTYGGGKAAEVFAASAEDAAKAWDAFHPEAPAESVEEAG